MNFSVIHAFITKAIHSLGSENLIGVSESVSEKIDSPASFIAHHGIKIFKSK